MDKSLLAFGLASFFNDIGSDMIAPVWAVFIVNILGADVSLLGFIEGLAVAVVAFSNWIAGWLSDFFGARKPFVVLGYFFSAIARIGYFFAFTPLMVVPFKIIDRFGKIRGPPRNALITDLTVKKRRGRAFGFLRGLDSLGALVGTTITLLIIGFVSVRSILLLAFIPSLISVFIILSFVKDVPVKRTIKRLSFRLTPGLKKLLFITGFFSFFSFNYSLLIVFAHDNGLSTNQTVFLYLILNLAYSALAYFFGWMSDRFGRKLLMSIGLLSFSLVCLFSITHLFFLVFLFFGVYSAIIDPVHKTLVAELAGKHLRATGIGSYNMIIGLLIISGYSFMGWLYDINHSLPFIVGLFSSLISSMLFFKFYESNNHSTY